MQIIERLKKLAETPLAALASSNVGQAAPARSKPSRRRVRLGEGGGTAPVTPPKKKKRKKDDDTDEDGGRRGPPSPAKRSEH
jgi:hypothetical protein